MLGVLVHVGYKLKTAWHLSFDQWDSYTPTWYIETKQSQVMLGVLAHAQYTKLGKV